MKITSIVVALLLTTAADELAKTRVSSLSMMAPAAWKKSDNQGTTRFAAPNGEAYFEVDVGEVQREGGMPAEECITKILAGVGADGYQRLNVGGAPAAVKVYVDTDEAGKAFTTHSYVGCNGRTTWSLQFHMVAAKKDRYAALADKVARSVQYAKGR